MAARPASAQSGPLAMGHHAAANELGVLEYCKGRGAVGSDAVDAQKTAIGRLPSASVDTGHDVEVGRTGAFAMPNGQTATLSDMAGKQNISVDALCKKLGDGVIRSVAATPSGGMTMPGMPAMPSMPTMPAMPH